MARSRINAKGRKESGSFMALPHNIIKSDQWALLSSKAIKLLIDLGAQYRGNNNGDLCATWSMMKERGWRSRDTLGKALKELEVYGWIERTKQGGMNIPNLYALSWRAIDDCKGKLDIASTNVASNLWKLDRPTRIPCNTDTLTVLNNGLPP